MISKRFWLLLAVSLPLLTYGIVATGNDLTFSNNQTSEEPLIITDSFTMYGLLFSGSISVVDNKMYLKRDYCPGAYCYPAGTRVIYLPEGEEEPPPPEPPQPPPEPQPPIASFTYTPKNPMVGGNIEFDTSASYDPDGYIVSYEWDFGDGSSGEHVHILILNPANIRSR